MNPALPAIEYLANAFNGLSLWRREQSVWGKRMRSRTFDRSLYLWMHRRGWMGRAEHRMLGMLVRPGMTVVDVGANIGLYTLHLAGLVGPSGRVVSFEPDPDLVPLLRDNCDTNGARNVEIHPMALGAGAEVMLLHRMAFNSGDNHLGPRGRPAFRRPIEVKVEALDTLMPGLRPDFIKVDVQGWELNVLRGMEETLRNSDAVVCVEFWPEGLRRAGSAPAELFHFVRSLGMEFYACGERSRLDEAAFLSIASKVRGMNYVNLLAARGGAPGG